MDTTADTVDAARARTLDTRRRWSLVLDLVLLAVVIAMLLIEDTSQLFKLVFFLLTIAAFFWGRDTFLLRAVFWTALTTAVLVGLVAVGRLPALELLDIPFAVAILVLVFTVTSRRDESRREVDRLLADEQDRSRRLTEVAELKADFTAIVVHEFGNPLAAIRRLTEMLEVEGLDADSRTALTLYATGALRTELATLDNLVADVQAAVAVDREDFTLRPRPIATQELVDDARRFAESLVGTKRVVVDESDGAADVWVLADRDRIAQVLRNLVSNAAKHSSTDGIVTVRARRTEGARIEMTVVDDGAGLDPEDLERIFERYGRGRRSARVDGLGLGLYISRRLVQAHGSDLWVRSSPGAGATFGFHLSEAAS
jgi:signal transduction histidine kinase